MIATFVSTWLLISLLRKYNIFDQPNIRSSHKIPTPRGGGITVVLILLATWCSLYISGHAFTKDYDSWIVFIGAIALASLSWIDDLRGGIPAIGRLFFHFSASTVVLVFLPADALVFHGSIPLWADRLITICMWVWFINLFNFMDGIDGISGTKTITISLGFLIISFFSEAVITIALPGLALASVAFGFLIWNWQPAKIFLGDVGSVTLGYLIGYLLINLAIIGHWDAALLLSAYYIFDSTFTLIKRVCRGEKPWKAHREHAYQIAVRNGKGHARVSFLIGVLGIILGILAIIGIEGGIWRWITLGIGLLIVLVFMWYLQIKPKPKVNSV